MLRACAGVAAALMCVLLIGKDTSPALAARAYAHARTMYLHGKLASSQREAEWGFQEFCLLEPRWAARFQRLQAETMVWQGKDAQALRLLAENWPEPSETDEIVPAYALQAEALIHRHSLTEAEAALDQGDTLCRDSASSGCGYLMKARGNLLRTKDDTAGARQQYLRAQAFAIAHHDLSLAGTAELNLGDLAVRGNRYGEAQDWTHLAYNDASAVGDEDLKQLATGNLGWAYFPYGDSEQSRQNFQQAARSAQSLGDDRSQIIWLLSMSSSDFWNGHYEEAIRNDREALELARRLDNKDAILNCLYQQMQANLYSGRLEEASLLMEQARAYDRADSVNQRQIRALLNAKLAEARRQDKEAERLFAEILKDKTMSVQFRSMAGAELGAVLLREGRAQDAEAVMKASLADFEASRAKTRGVASQLPLLTFGMPVYNGYLRMLAHQGRAEDALLIANQSRAQTLAHSLDTAKTPAALAQANVARLQPRQLARQSGATLLFYWMGRDESYLWAVTPEKVSQFLLPKESELIPQIVRYRTALMNAEDTAARNNADGRALYSTLIAPVASMIRPGSSVIVLDDMMLSKLNFETLLAPGKSAGDTAQDASHYWIEDVTIRSAPSLSVLAEPVKAMPSGARMLMMGNAISASTEFPELPMASLEMKMVGKHFAGPGQVSIAHAEATPAAYLASDPGRFAYLHFVTHGMASSSDPLDSSIILSRNRDGDHAYKLYARDILEHRLNARLVTISACYGSGSRTYSGEGLVGLSWAFLGAGAHNVIGSLWEVSDESTPRLMDGLYQGLEQGWDPPVALRRAKLNLLHGNSAFRAPFFWAPFQMYSGH